MMKDIRARLVAYVQPPGVTWCGNEGVSDLHHIFMNTPNGYRFAVIQHKGKYEVVDFYQMGRTTEGWFMPTFGLQYDDGDAAVVATVLLNQ